MMITSHTAAPKFQLRTRYSALRDIAVITVCVAIVGGFLIQVLSGPTPQQLHTAAERASIHLRA